MENIVLLASPVLFSMEISWSGSDKPRCCSFILNTYEQGQTGERVRASLDNMMYL